MHVILVLFEFTAVARYDVAYLRTMKPSYTSREKHSLTRKLSGIGGKGGVKKEGNMVLRKGR